MNTRFGFPQWGQGFGGTDIVRWYRWLRRCACPCDAELRPAENGRRPAALGRCPPWPFDPPPGRMVPWIGAFVFTQVPYPRAATTIGAAAETAASVMKKRLFWGTPRTTRSA